MEGLSALPDVSALCYTTTVDTHCETRERETYAQLREALDLKPDDAHRLSRGYSAPQCCISWMPAAGDEKSLTFQRFQAGKTICKCHAENSHRALNRQMPPDEHRELMTSWFRTALKYDTIVCPLLASS